MLHIEIRGRHSIEAIEALRRSVSTADITETDEAVVSWSPDLICESLKDGQDSPRVIIYHNNRGIAAHIAAAISKELGSICDIETRPMWGFVPKGTKAVVGKI